MWAATLSACSVEEVNWLLPALCRPCTAVGRERIDERYCGAPSNGTAGTGCSICADNCVGVWTRWKSALAGLLGTASSGFWYSTPVEAACDRAATGRGHVLDPGSCEWRELRTGDAINASCVATSFLTFVESFGQACFRKCPHRPGPVRSGASRLSERAMTSPWDQTTDCYIECIFATILGPSHLFPNATGQPLPANTLVQVFRQALDSTSCRLPVMK